MSLTTKTPLGNDIVVPNKLLEDAILQEWQGQGDTKSLKRENMPLSQIASIKIDLVQNKRAELINDIISYSDTDSICYRAGDIEELFIRQELVLGPIIAWANRFFSISLIITSGIMPIIQHPHNKIKFAEQLAGYDDWKLAVFASIIKQVGSIVLVFAFIEGAIDAEQLFAYSHLEEEYQDQKWGKDEEKDAKLEQARKEILAAEKFLRLLLQS